MQHEKVSTALVRESSGELSALRASLTAREPVFLRMQGSFPAMFGYLVYEDPYVDYVTVRILGVEATDGAVPVWAGTHEAFHSTWETFLPSGVS